MRVKCLAQEHNTMTRPWLEPGPLDPESSTLTTRPPCLPTLVDKHTVFTHDRYFTTCIFSVACLQFGSKVTRKWNKYLQKASFLLLRFHEAMISIKDF